MLYYFAYLSTLEGVPVIMAGGNSGPDWFSVANAVPWILTVGASNIDRKMSTSLVLGNGTVFSGVVS